MASLCIPHPVLPALPPLARAPSWGVPCHRRVESGACSGFPVTGPHPFELLPWGV